MPRIKRWFPVSHDINSDAEVWQMRRAIGEKSLSVWLEILSIADRNESELPGDYQELIRSIAGKCQATTRTVTAVFQHAKSCLWLDSQPTLRVVKYAIYHKTREPNKIPRGKQLASPPSEPSEPNLKKEILKKEKPNGKYWPDDDRWLFDWLTTQTYFPIDRYPLLLNYPWWDKFSETTPEGLNVKDLEETFLEMAEWTSRKGWNPKPSGIRRFISSWIHRKAKTQ